MTCLAAVENERSIVPFSDRMKKLFINECLIDFTGTQECIQIPPVVIGQVCFYQETVISAVLLKVEKTLFLETIGIGTENYLKSI